MIFEDVTPSDVADVIALINAAYRSPGAVPGWTDERDLLEGPRIDGTTILPALAAGRFVAMRPSPGVAPVACIHISAGEDGWYLSLLAVDPARQSKGFGAALLDEVTRQAIAARAPHLRITVIQHRATLIAWYERRGFRRTGETVAFPYDDPTVGRPLRDDLTLVVLDRDLSASEAQNRP